MKNAGFVALIILFGLIIFAASNQPSTLKTISSTQAINDTNAGKYSKISVNSNELDITPKGESKATLKTYVDANSSLKEQGFNTSKVAVSYKPVSSSSSTWISVAESVVPVYMATRRTRLPSKISLAVKSLSKISRKSSSF